MVRALQRRGSFLLHGVCVAVTGVLLGVAFAPVGWWFAAYVALVPVGILAVRSPRGGRVLVTSWVVFFLWWLIKIQWIISVHWLAWISISAALGLYLGGAVWAMHWLSHRYRSAMVMTLPMVWISMEYLRGMFPVGGFAWLSLGHSQAAYLPAQSPGWIVQTADLFGEHTVGFIVAMTSGLLVDLLTRPLMRPGARGIYKVRKTIRAGVVLWTIVFVGALLYGRVRVQQEPGSGSRGVVVAVVQTNVPQDNKIHRTAEQDARDFAQVIALTRQVMTAQPQPDLILWPESTVPAAVNVEAIDFFTQTLTGWSDRKIYHEQIKHLARELEVSLLVGAPAWSKFMPITLADGRRIIAPSVRTNSAFLYHADGQRSPARYDKQHLVPFGEYLPLVGITAWTRQFYLDHISPYPYVYELRAGRLRTVFDLPGEGETGITEVTLPEEGRGGGGEVDRAGEHFRGGVTAICYEDAVGRVVRDLVYEADGTKRASVVMNLTNSAWFIGQSMRPQHFQIAVLRAIENRVPVVRAVNGGISGFISSVGRVGPVVEQNGQTQNIAGTLASTVNLDERASVYGRVGTMPIAVMAGVTGILIAGGLFRPRNK